MLEIKQSHFGSGDNIVGDKIIHEDIEQKNDKSIPLWLKWIVAIFGIVGVLWPIIMYYNLI